MAHRLPRSFISYYQTISSHELNFVGCIVHKKAKQNYPGYKSGIILDFEPQSASGGVNTFKLRKVSININFMRTHRNVYVKISSTLQPFFTSHSFVRYKIIYYFMSKYENINPPYFSTVKKGHVRYI